MELSQWLVIGLSVVIGLWFALGFLRNRQLNKAYYRWLANGLQDWGQPAHKAGDKTPPPGMPVALQAPRPPFRRLEAALRLAPRENMPLAIYRFFQRQQDELILKADLQPAPACEVAAAPDGNRELNALLHADPRKRYKAGEAPDGYLLAYRGPHDKACEAHLRALLDRFATAQVRIALQPKAPHLVLRARLAGLATRPASELFAALAALSSGEPDP